MRDIIKFSLILFSNPDNLENELIPPRNNVSHDRKRLTMHISNTA